MCMMYLWVNFLLSVAVHMGFLYVVARELTRDRHSVSKEFGYLLLISVSNSIVRVLVLRFEFPNLSSHLFTDMNFWMILLLYFPTLFIYFYSVKLENGKNAISLVALTVSIVLMSDFILDASFATVFPELRLYWTMTLSQNLPHILLHIILHLTLSFGIVVVLKKLTKRTLNKIHIDRRLQNVVLCCSLILLTISTSVLFTFYSRGEEFFDNGWSHIYVGTFVAVYIIVAGVVVHTKLLRNRYEHQKKEEEYKSMQNYLHQVELQNSIIQKFKHDYQNILLSISGFIENDDLAGLKQYYYSKIEATSAIIAKDSFALTQLSKINVLEIKSILAAKLMTAQNIDIDIEATFEANEKIDYFPVDSVVLVRVLGILLDNALEELHELGKGALFVGCYKWENGITFIVKNTCRSDLPPIKTLWEKGFSTKGAGRGLGLVNLSELLDTCENVTLKTSISQDSFCQELLIDTGGEEEA